MNKAVSNKIQHLYNEAYDLCIAEVERIARKILKKNPELDEFVMAMGGWVFVAKPNADGYKDCLDNLDPRCKEFLRWEIEWNEQFHFTGEPMRFTVDGIVVREWGGTVGMTSKQIAEE